MTFGNGTNVTFDANQKLAYSDIVALDDKVGGKSKYTREVKDRTRRPKAKDIATVAAPQAVAAEAAVVRKTFGRDDIAYAARTVFLWTHAAFSTSSAKHSSSDAFGADDDAIDRQIRFARCARALPKHWSIVGPFRHTPAFADRVRTPQAGAVPDFIADSPASPPPPSPTQHVVAETLGAASAMAVPALGLIRPSPPPDSGEPPPASLSVPSSPELVERIRPPRYDNSRLFPGKYEQHRRSRCLGPNRRLKRSGSRKRGWGPGKVGYKHISRGESSEVKWM